MRSPIGEVSTATVTAGLTLAAGVALWRLGIEFERAWLRSLEEAMPGASLPARAVTETQAGSASWPGDGRRRPSERAYRRATPAAVAIPG